MSSWSSTCWCNYWRACRHGTALPAAVGLHPAIEKALACLNDDPTDDLRAVAAVAE